MSGDFSIAADGSFPFPKTPEYDRKIVLIVRQDLDDDPKEIMTGEHATRMVHLAERAEKGRMIEDMQYVSAARCCVTSNRSVLGSKGTAMTLRCS